jgi:hypothetical protein
MGRHALGADTRLVTLRFKRRLYFLTLLCTVSLYFLTTAGIRLVLSTGRDLRHFH